MRAKKYRVEHPKEDRLSKKKWRDANPEAERLIQKKWRYAQKTKKERVVDYLIQKYGDTPCMDCGGVFEWCAMDFDHRPGEVKELKIGPIGWRTASLKNIDKVEKEIAKCDLVCSNCHRIRTYITRKQDA